MHTVRWPMCFNNHQMSALVAGGPIMNKLEQVSSDGHQMSLVEGKWGPCPLRSMSGGGMGSQSEQVGTGLQ